MASNDEKNFENPEMAADEGSNSDEEHEYVNDEDTPSVKLMRGLVKADLHTQEGAMIEIDEADLAEHNRELKNDSGIDKEIYKYAKCELLDISSEDEDDDLNEMKRTPFEKIAVQMVDITPNVDGGILKRILVKGDGSVVPATATVTVHYNGYFEFNEEPFDSTRLRGRRFTFKLQDGKVVAGLEKGIMTMRSGEKAYFMIRSEYAYGPMGCPPRIPKNATVLFEVELFSFIDDSAVQAFNNLSPEEQIKMKFEELMKVCLEDHQWGNKYFKESMYDKAKVRYEHGLHLLEMHVLKNESEQLKSEALLVKLLINLAQVKLRLGKHKPAMSFAYRALKFDSNNQKAIYIAGRCHSELGDYAKARRLLLQAREMTPKDSCINKELEKLGKKMRESTLSEKALYQKMFSSLRTNDAVDTEIEKSRMEKKKEMLEVSKNFQEIIETQLAEFKVDNARNEMILPEGLSIEEQTFVATTAKILDMNVRPERHAGGTRFKVYK